MSPLAASFASTNGNANPAGEVIILEAERGRAGLEQSIFAWTVGDYDLSRFAIRADLVGRGEGVQPRLTVWFTDAVDAIVTMGLRACFRFRANVAAEPQRRPSEQRRPSQTARCRETHE
jgi:hypothetical protein